MKKQKAILIKDFYSANGALHAGDKVIIEEKLDDQVRVQNNLGQIYIIPRHIVKIIA